jgi:hypothetical protein
LRLNELQVRAKGYQTQCGKNQAQDESADDDGHAYPTGARRTKPNPEGADSAQNNAGGQEVKKDNLCAHGVQCALTSAMTRTMWSA